jgi:hypothetical protein
MGRLRESIEYLERVVDNPDLLEDCDAALADALYDTRYPHRATVKAPRDSGIISASLARDLASGAWRSEL